MSACVVCVCSVEIDVDFVYMYIANSKQICFFLLLYLITVLAATFFHVCGYYESAEDSVGALPVSSNALHLE